MGLIRLTTRFSLSRLKQELRSLRCVRTRSLFTLVRATAYPVWMPPRGLNCCTRYAVRPLTRQMWRTFLLLVEAFLTRQEAGVDRHALTSFFRSMDRLFAVTPAKDLQAERRGLWGELFMMSRVKGFRFWSPFWHSEVTRRFDFSCGRNRIEVKMTTRPERMHHFSHRQIYAIEGDVIIIASIVAAEDDSGLSLRELIDDCRSALLGMPDYLKLEKAVRQACMESSTEFGPVIDAAEAEENLAWFRSIDIPHFRVPEPTGVTETRYKVDLSTAQRVTAMELDEWLRPWSLELLAVAASR